MPPMSTHSYDDRVQIARLIVTLLDDWGVRPADQITLLALPADTPPRSMRRYRDNTPLPEDPAIAERVEHLVGIADALRTTFPRNANMGSIWLHRRNQRFGNRTPLATMLEDGLLGLITVRAHLDCAWDWDQSGSKA
ncbi:MAG: antitoxin Xre/MbcA/ParS toxin-binding domain-containing protein [Gammaproteobacteria bacterium]